MLGHRLARTLSEAFGVAVGVVLPFVERDAERQVGQRVVRRGLVGDDVDVETATQQLGQHVGAVVPKADAQRAALGLGREHSPHGFVEVVGPLVEVALLDAALEPARVDVDHEYDAAVHRDRERLRAAHAAAAAGDRERAGQRAAEALLGDGGEGLVGALDDALGADVDPAAGGHLAVHGQPEVLEAAELGPVGPVGDQVAVGDEHARRPLMCAHDADRLARLHEHGLVGFQRLQRAAERVERLPAACSSAGAAVDHEVVGVLGDLRVEVVLQHAQRGFLLPAEGGQLEAAR